MGTPSSDLNDKVFTINTLRKTTPRKILKTRDL
jgi:hypothetical protein